MAKTGKTIEVRRDTHKLMIPGTGESFDVAVPSQAAAAYAALREAEEHLASLRREVGETLIEEARRQGRKTLKFDETRLVVEISGGPGATYIDPVELRKQLGMTKCPSERIEEAIKTVVEEKVDRSVCRQLATNPDYKKAIEAATRVYEKTYSVRVG